jgi:MFS-type transporter involved in bile tolerance (Atg22 family)
MPRPGWVTRPVLAWALYDVATSTFAAVVATFFGVFFVAVVALLYGAIATATGSQAVALVSLLVFLAAGAALFVSLRMPSPALAAAA